MSRLAMFLGGVLAGAVTLGVVSCLVSTYTDRADEEDEIEALGDEPENQTPEECNA